MAKGLIDPKTAAGGKAARDYYDIFREEPTSQDITSIVEQPEIIAHASLSTLLDAIISAFAYRHFQGPDVLIVAHGNEKGLIMPLVLNSQTSAFTQVLESLIGDDSPETKAKRTRLSQKQVSSLLDQIAAVQNLGLGAIEFRGCVIGSRQENLEVLKEFFGAWRVSAPTVKSNFGWVRPVPTKYDEKTWKAFVRNYRNAEEYTYDSEHFALAIIPETHQSFAISESTSVVQAWIEDKLPSSLSSYSYSGGQFPVHSLSTTPRTFPTDSDYIDYIAMSST